MKHMLSDGCEVVGQRVRLLCNGKWVGEVHCVRDPVVKLPAVKPAVDEWRVVGRFGGVTNSHGCTVNVYNWADIEHLAREQLYHFWAIMGYETAPTFED